MKKVVATLAMLLLVGCTQSVDTPPTPPVVPAPPAVPDDITYQILTADCDLLDGYLQVTEQMLKESPDDKMGKEIKVLILWTLGEKRCL